MKKLIIILGIVGLFFSMDNATGQTTAKYGHLNSNEIIGLMPETDSAQLVLQRSSENFQATIEEIQAEFNKKYQEYQNLLNNPATPALTIRTKEEELQSTQERAQNYQTSAQQELSDQQARLFQPIQEKFIAAVEAVAQANGYTYIFDLAAGSIIFTADQSNDVTPLVLQELGVQ